MEQVESADGTSIAFERAGSGPPLILVGGAFCDHRARAAGLPLAAGLISKFTVFCYDRRGRGTSSDHPDYAPAREVEDLAALIGAAGGSAHVYGHSSGAVLALEAALSGLSIAKLALFEPPLVLGGDREPVPHDLVDKLRDYTAQGKRSEAVELFLTRAIGLAPPAVAYVKSGPDWPALEALAHTLSYDARITRDPRALLERASAAWQTALVIDGARSPTWMRAGVAKLARVMPAARHVSMPGQTHDVDPDLLAALLLDFFAS
jgi:pimeloyl-ACP methyl ester carboxylesterase